MLRKVEQPPCLAVNVGSYRDDGFGRKVPRQDLVGKLMPIVRLNVFLTAQKLLGKLLQEFRQGGVVGMVTDKKLVLMLVEIAAQVVGAGI